MGRIYTQKFYKGTRIYGEANGPQIERIVKDEVDEKALQEEFNRELTRRLANRKNVIIQK